MSTVAWPAALRLTTACGTRMASAATPSSKRARTNMPGSRSSLGLGTVPRSKTVPVEEDDTPERLQARVLKIEHEILPLCVKLLCEGKIVKEGRRVRVSD